MEAWQVGLTNFYEKFRVNKNVGLLQVKLDSWKKISIIFLRIEFFLDFPSCQQ